MISHLLTQTAEHFTQRSRAADPYATESRTTKVWTPTGSLRCRVGVTRTDVKAGATGTVWRTTTTVYLEAGTDVCLDDALRIDGVAYRIAGLAPKATQMGLSHLEAEVTSMRLTELPA